jgi:hypothetical protein
MSQRHEIDKPLRLVDADGIKGDISSEEDEIIE